MVRSRRILLSIAVLGVEAVLGGPLGRRDDVAVNDTALLTGRPPPIPLTRPTPVVVVEITASINLSIDDGGIQQPASTPAAAPTVPSRPGAVPPAIPVPKPAVTVEEGSFDFGAPTTSSTPAAAPTVPSRPGAVPPAIPAPKPPMVVEEEVINFGAPTTTTPPTVPTVPSRPGAVPPVIPAPNPPMVVEEEVINLGAPTTTTPPTVPTVPSRPGGVPPVIPAPNPPMVVEEEVISFGTPTTTTPPNVPTVPTRTGGPPVVQIGPPAVVTPAKVVSLEQTFDFGDPSPNADPDAVETGKEYTYPGIWVSGTLVTQSVALTRPVVPTAKSVPPNSSTRKSGPPVIGAGVNQQVSPSVDEDGAAPQVTAALPTAPRGPPPKIITKQISVFESTDIDLGGGTTLTPSDHGSRPASSTITTTPPAPTSICVGTDLERMQTTYSIVYTTTLTWVGNPEDYTPLYPTLEIPPTPACVLNPDPARLTFATATATSTIAFCSTTGTGTKFVTCLTTTSTWQYASQIPITEPFMAPGNLGPPATGMVTVITTDKNPAVVYPTKKAPNYGVTSAPRTQDNHGPVTTPIAVNDPPGYDQDPATKSPMRQPPTTDPVTVAVKPTAVVINDHTITDAPGGETQKVVVGGVTFTIDPSQVVGGGATIDRNLATGGGGFASTPTTSRLGNINVVVSSSIAVVGGTSFTIGTTPKTAVVSGQTVVISPSAVVIGSETLAVPTLPKPTEVVVAGGDLITAIGQSVAVIKSTTITYGLTGSSTTVIDNDTITFGEGGVTIHGTTLGGKTAKPGATDFAVAGGATITKIGASIVVIGGSTYTVGPGTGSTTTVVGGETITIGPDGVKVSTLNLPYPFGPTTVITPKATATEPTETGASASEDAAPGLRPDGSSFVAAACLAVGMIFFGV